MSSRLNGALSPPIPLNNRSGASSPQRQKFPSDTLRPYIKTLLTKTLTNASWDSNDKAKMAAYSKEISERVKQRMIEIEPRGFKYIVTTTLSENVGQAGRADMSCHWEDTDSAIQEMFSNESIIFVCIAFAVRLP
ncbi:hypothetical protein L486_06734 [Kwoniella mangroviensis CBS 10435]|uniref:Topoisomerase I damage affected protein 2 n=1 Tax=Kwoniella mangroviensis CBS 10435 TaxID=1331196 RepID=A0A1B9IKE7_9TREE|nr:uncharacterized protein I203_05433 [Kwoniella mangroviensis CBS 8507]OCF55977.1 hypothetical protein L486_06734 [Kwoniella mangroviensis CBS 10435]OCF65752.1 hypothetical protein I203_05433 [Kwoniella mangroviensis CBS 8507]